MSQIQKLKFRSFSSKEKEGFILFTIGPKLPLIILEDILYQLFQPLFPQILCPEIYFFSSTDKILKVEDIYKIQDFLYVHFLERVPKYKAQQKIDAKLKLCDLDKLSKGIGLKGASFYIFSEKQYMMYSKNIFLKNTQDNIKSISENADRKQLLYNQYFDELDELKDNIQMISLKNQLKERVDQYRGKVQTLDVTHARFMKVKKDLAQVLQKSGIYIKSLNQLN